VRVLGLVALRVGIAAVLGVFLAGIVVPVHRDGYNCGAMANSRGGNSVIYPAASAGRSYPSVVHDCSSGFRYRALILGASAALGAVIALHGFTAVTRRR
jgi:hypothetical protein